MKKTILTIFLIGALYVASDWVMARETTAPPTPPANTIKKVNLPKSVVEEKQYSVTFETDKKLKSGEVITFKFKKEPDGALEEMKQTTNKQTYRAPKATDRTKGDTYTLVSARVGEGAEVTLNAQMTVKPNPAELQKAKRTAIAAVKKVRDQELKAAQEAYNTAYKAANETKKAAMEAANKLTDKAAKKVAKKTAEDAYKAALKTARDAREVARKAANDKFANAVKQINEGNISNAGAAQ